MSIPRSRPHRTDALAPLPFPHEQARAASCNGRSLGESVIQRLESMSRRIEDLARELNCLGYFEDDDRPRAA